MREIIIQLTDADYNKFMASGDYKCDLVRCKDCQYWYSEMDTTFWKPCDEIATEREWFCANGTRRADDDTR